MPSVNLMWDTGDATITVDNGAPIEVTGATEKLLTMDAGQHVIKIDFENGASIEKTVNVPDVINSTEVAAIVASKQGYLNITKIYDNLRQVWFEGAKTGIKKVDVLDNSGNVIQSFENADPTQVLGSRQAYTNNTNISISELRVYDADDNLVDIVDVAVGVGATTPIELKSVADDRKSITVKVITDGVTKLKIQTVKPDNSTGSASISNPANGQEYTITPDTADEEIKYLFVSIGTSLYSPVYTIRFSEAIASGDGSAQTIQCWQITSDSVTKSTMSKDGADDSWFAEFKYGSAHPDFTATLPSDSIFEVSVADSPYIGDDNCDLARISIKSSEVSSLEEDTAYTDTVTVKDLDGNDVDKVGITLHIKPAIDAKYYFHARASAAYVQYNAGQANTVNGGNVVTYNQYQSNDNSFINNWILPMPYSKVSSASSYNATVFWTNSALVQSDKATITSSHVSQNIEVKIAILDEASNTVADSGWFIPHDYDGCYSLSIANGSGSATLKTMVLSVRAKGADVANIPANTSYLALTNLGGFLTKVG